MEVQGNNLNRLAENPCSRLRFFVPFAAAWPSPVLGGFVMDTYVIGNIPSLSAWEGETLSFKMTSRLGDGVKFSKRAMPKPQGQVSIDEKTGVFTYEPATEDKEQFAVWIRARKGAKDDTLQKISITPHPQLPSEFRIIEHVSADEPDRASTFYTTFSKEDAGKAHFNREGLEGEAEVMTAKVTIAGVRVIIEENADEGSLYQRLIGVGKKLRQLTLCADEVVIRCELKLPGTEVHIYARELRFEDPNGKIARIDTTPDPLTKRATRFGAMTGQKGGRRTSLRSESHNAGHGPPFHHHWRKRTTGRARSAGQRGHKRAGMGWQGSGGREGVRPLGRVEEWFPGRSRSR
jgi:hypothetical protein